jgi:hypothetical protein
MPKPDMLPSSAPAVRTHTFHDAFDRFKLAVFSLGCAEWDFNRSVERFDEGPQRRLNHAFEDVQSAAQVVRSLHPEDEVDVLRRESVVLLAALLRHESAANIRKMIGVG